MTTLVCNWISQQPREVKVTMIPYVKEIVTLFKQYDDSEKTAKTPASEHLFKMRKDIQVLPEKQVAIFHTFVVKNLFASKCTWPDISVAVAFLCTQVKNPDEDNWKKLIQLIHYLHGMEELPLILHADATTVGKGGGSMVLMPFTQTCMVILVAACPSVQVCQSRD